jgi:phage-related protein
MTDVLSFIDADGVETVLRHRRGTTGRFMPLVVMRDEPVAGQDGTRLRDLRYDARQVVVPVVIDGVDRSAYRQALRDIAHRLDPKRGNGRIRSSLDGVVRELTCRYLDGMGFSEDFFDVGVPSLLFRAFDPFWYDTAVTAISVGPTQASFFPIFPLRLSGSEVYADTAVDNSGDVETWPQWTVTGPGNGPVLRNLTTGKAIDLTGVVLGVGETVEIDTRPGMKTVRRGDGSNLYGDMATGSSLWPLVKGSNSLRLEMSATTAASSFALRYSRRWLSA